MKPVLFVAVSVALVAGISCQLTPEQMDCFVREAENIDPDVLQSSCNVTRLYSEEAIFEICLPDCLNNVFGPQGETCNYNIYRLCRILDLPTPTDAQLTCIEGSEDAINAVCGNLLDNPDFNAAFDIACASGTCRETVQGVYDNCGYPLNINIVCDGSIEPTSEPSGPLTPEQSICFMREAENIDQDVFQKSCNITRLLSDEAIFEICRPDCLNDVFGPKGETCNFDIYRLCRILDLPAPTSTQAMCIESSEDGINAVCGNLLDNPDINAVFDTACNNGLCRDTLQSVYDGCEYEINIDFVCDGSVKLLAVPMVVLLFSMLSMLF